MANRFCLFDVPPDMLPPLPEYMLLQIRYRNKCMIQVQVNAAIDRSYPLTERVVFSGETADDSAVF